MTSAFYLFSDCYCSTKMPPVNSKTEGIDCRWEINLLTAIENKGVRTLTDLSIELGVLRTTLFHNWGAQSINFESCRGNKRQDKKQTKEKWLSANRSSFIYMVQGETSTECATDFSCFEGQSGRIFGSFSISKDGFARTVGYQGGERDMQVGAKLFLVNQIPSIYQLWINGRRQRRRKFWMNFQQPKNMSDLGQLRSAHNVVTKPSNIQLKFLPPKRTSVLQPCDCVIIYAFQQRYRKELLLRYVSQLDNLNVQNFDVFVGRHKPDEISMETNHPCNNQKLFQKDRILPHCK